MIVNTDPRHSAMEARALATVAKPLDEHELAWESAHTGGGCMAWASDCDDGAARILICDEGNTLGDDQTESWLVGLHPHAEWNDHWEDEAKTLEEALNLATLAMAARAFALGFRADAPMTFREFVASGRDVADIGADIGCSEEDGATGRIYADRCYINGAAGDWSLTISNGSWSGPLPGLERRLYEYAAREGYLSPRSPAPAPVAQWQREFPHFPAGDMPAIPAGWKDASWRNDACPCFLASPWLSVFVDFADPAKREEGGGERFAVFPMEDGMHPAKPAGPLFVSDDWQAVLEFVAAYVPPASPDAGEAAPVILPQAGNLDALSAELTAYCETHGLEPASADEMILALGVRVRDMQAHINWLHDFCERWEAEERRIAEGSAPVWDDDFADQPDAVARLASAFHAVLLEWCGSLGIARIRRDNVAHAGTNICASHDECDANMAMEEAMRRTFGAGPLDGPQEHMTDAAVTLWSDAWDKAKAEFLTDAA